MQISIKKKKQKKKIMKEILCSISYIYIYNDLALVIIFFEQLNKNNFKFSYASVAKERETGRWSIS